MNKKKVIFITGFALFSLFFGAGNLLLPPLLGYNAGTDWFWVTLGFMITAILSCVVGIAIGQLDFHSIIVIALPVLMLIYPITIVLILLNVLPEKYATDTVFKVVVFVTILFSLPDFLSLSYPLKTWCSYNSLCLYLNLV